MPGSLSYASPGAPHSVISVNELQPSVNALPPELCDMVAPLLAPSLHKRRADGLEHLLQRPSGQSVTWDTTFA